MYISLNQGRQWSAPIWMGEAVNSGGYDGNPFVTNDGRHLIFTSSRGSTDEKVYFNHYIVDFKLDDWKSRGM